MSMSPEHQAELRRARVLLENPGLLVKLASTLGRNIDELGAELLPAAVNRHFKEALEQALHGALRAAVWSLPEQPGPPRRALHRTAAGVAGGVSGFFGAGALLVELPLTTTIIMRSIVDVARSQGERAADPETQMNCLQVFALGGSSTADDGGETSYYAVRLGLAKAVGEAAAHGAARGAGAQGGAALARLISTVAGRFGVVVSEKAAAQALPAVGAFGGALVNTLFISHFQDMAEGHFTVRRLERIYGAAGVREAYGGLTRRSDPAGA